MIRYFNRVTGREEHETVLGDRWINLAYGTRVGLWLVRCLLVRRWVSRVMGSLQNSRWSRHRIPQFVRELQIRTEDFESGPYPSFNSYFVRRFREGVRTFEAHPGLMPAFAEARYFGYASREEGADQDADIRYPVKGRYLTAGGLLGPRTMVRSPSWKKVFEGGPLLIARLCPADYHRFHFPDRGKWIERYRVPGALHSVNPVALRAQPDLFILNEREVSILETENFGRLAYIEVGAMMVGRIIQTALHTMDRGFERGEEKGYFLFGGSTVIVMGERGAWTPDEDVIRRTSQGIETWVPLGQGIAKRGTKG